MKLRVKLDTRFRVSDIERDDKTSDWIEKHQQANQQKLPSLPNCLIDLVAIPLGNGLWRSYVKDEPITKEFVVIPISGQQWQSLTDGERGQLLELVEWLENQTAEDYCRLFQSMFPRDPDFSKRKA